MLLLSIFVQIAIVAASVIPSSPPEQLTTRQGPVTLPKPGPCYTHLQFKQVCVSSEPEPYINISKFYNGDTEISDVGWHNFIGHNGRSLHDFSQGLKLNRSRYERYGHQEHRPSRKLSFYGRRVRYTLRRAAQAGIPVPELLVGYAVC